MEVMMDYTSLDWDAIISNAAENSDVKQALFNAAQQAAVYDGSCDWADVFDMGDFDGMVTVDSPLQFAYNLFNGGFDPSKEYWRIEDHGWYESLDSYDILNEAWEYRDEVAEAASRIDDVAETLADSGEFDIPEDDEEDW